MLLESVHCLLFNISLQLSIGLFLKQLLSDITLKSGECLLAVYTLITLLHGYPYFCFEFFVLAEILPRTCTIWLCGRERETGCFICVCDCECQFLCLVMRYPLIVYVSDSGFQSWSLCLTVCSSVGLCV